MSRYLRRKVLITNMQPADLWPLVVAAPSEDPVGYWISGGIGVFGALLGSAVTVAWTEWFNHRTRKRQQAHRLNAGSLSIFHKLTRIYSNARMLRGSIQDGQALAERDQNPHPTLTTLAHASYPSPIELNSEELWVATTVGGADLFNAVSDLDQRHNVLVASFASWGEGRTSLVDQLEPDSLVGLKASSDLKPAKRLALTVRLRMLNAMLHDLSETSTAIATDALEGLRLLTDSPRHPLGPEFEFVLVGLDGEDVKFRAPLAKR